MSSLAANRGLPLLSETLDHLFRAWHKYRCFVNRSSVRPRRWDAGYHCPVFGLCSAVVQLMLYWIKLYWWSQVIAYSLSSRWFVLLYSRSRYFQEPDEHASFPLENCTRITSLSGPKTCYHIGQKAVITYFWIRDFFPDTATVHTYLANSTANPGKNKSALQSGKKYICNESDNVWTGPEWKKNKSATNPITCGRVNPDIFLSDDVKSVSSLSLNNKPI